MAESTDLSKTELLAKLERLKARTASIGERMDQTSEELIDTAVTVGAAYGIGYMKANAQRLGQQLTISGMDPTSVLGGIGLVVGKNVKGQTGRFIKGASRGLLAAWGYEAGIARGRTA